MARLKWKPGHPLADKDGWVKEEDYKAYYKYGMSEKQYMEGNTPVSFHYIPDEMAPTRHMIDGKYYTSKKKFRNETKARGCVEVGNDTAALLKERKPILLDPRQRREDIQRAVYELRNGRDIMSEVRRDLERD